MSLSIGIVGLPNVGKSTTFNALTGAQNAAVANYPFCTIRPNRAIVPLSDQRLEILAELVSVHEVIHSTVEFVDIAGLVKGASKGEGLGNKFLGHIRDTTAILHVVRCFDDPNVAHISEKPDPETDIEIINIELALADLEQIERKIERLRSAVKGDKKLQATLDYTLTMQSHLENGLPAYTLPGVDDKQFNELNHELRLLTAKPMIYIANVDEDCLAKGNLYVQSLSQIAAEKKIELVILCAELEQQLQEMELTERKEYMQLLGVESSGLEQVIRKSFTMLNLISFFTFNEREARSWNIPKGSTAPKAAGEIHTDFERGFIRAEVIPFPIFEKLGSAAAVKAEGLLHLEGKDYIVQDGDVIYFRFNV